MNDDGWKPLELRIVRRTVLYPSVYLPLFITRASLLLMLSWVFFCNYNTTDHQNQYPLIGRATFKDRKRYLQSSSPPPSSLLKRCTKSLREKGNRENQRWRWKQSKCSNGEGKWVKLGFESSLTLPVLKLFHGKGWRNCKEGYEWLGFRILESLAGQWNWASFAAWLEY